MIENLVFEILVFLIFELPLGILLARAVIGKREVTKTEVYLTLSFAVLLAMNCVLKISRGEGVAAVSFFDIYCVLLAILEQIFFSKQNRKDA